MKKRNRYFPKIHSATAAWFSSIKYLLLAMLILPMQAHAVDMLVSSFTDAPDPAVRGGTIVYTASITNNTTDTAHDVGLVFTLDAQTAFVSVSDAACIYAAGTHQVTCSYASLAGDLSGPGTAQVKSIQLTVRNLAGAGNTVAANVNVVTSDADSNPANDTLNQTTTIDNGADLALTLTANPSSVPASGSVTYTASQSNLGPNDAGAVSSTFTLSPHLTYTSASGSGWSCGAVGQVVTCNRAAAAVGALPDIAILAKVTGAFTGTITTTGLVAISGSATDYNNANDASTVDVTVTTGTDLAISKSASGAVLPGGVAMSFTLAPRNLGPFAASNVTVTDTLPAGFSSINAAGTGWTCGVVAQTVTCTRASYAVGASDDITVNTVAPAVGSATTFTNNTSISSTTDDGVSANNTASVSVDILPDGVDLSITKSKSPDPVAQGANMTSTMRVTNHGPRAAASGEIKIVDTLPVGESFVAMASGSNWTCGPQVGQTVTCTYNAALAVGSSTPDLLLTTTAVATGTLSNTACTNYANGGIVDPTPGNNCASASVTSTANGVSVDLQISKAANIPVLAWNAPSETYTITVTNAGPGAATGIVMTDPLPGFLAGSTGVTASLTGGTSAASFNCTTGATVTCSQTAGAMNVGETAIFSVVVSRPWLDSAAQAGNLWTNTASVRSTNQGDTNLGNNSASASVQVDPVADVTIVNSVTPTTALAGTQATYVLTISNHGPSAANAVTVSDVFGIAGGTMTFLSATPSVGSCAAFNSGSNTLNCSLGDLASGGTATITVVVRPDYMVAPPSPRTITNTATVATSTQESNNANNVAPIVLTVTAAALDLLINNTDNVDPLGFVPASAGPVFPDNVVTYRNAITNRGPSVASGLVLTYVMRPPAGKSMTFLGDKLAATGQAYSNYCNNLGAQVTGPATQTLTCTFPPAQILEASNSVSNLYLDYRVDTQPNTAGDAYSSTASITSNEADTVASNNSANQTTTIKMRTDLQLTKSARAFIGGADAATNTIQIRQPYYWVLTLTNAGPGDSQATTVTDTLPAGMSLYTGGSIAPYNAAPYNAGVRWANNNGTPGSGTCSGSSTITCNLGLLESGRVARILVPVISDTFSATRQNCASASTSEVDPNAANNTAVCSTINMQRATVEGKVYHDANNDGAKAVAEAGISGVTLRLNGSDIYGNTITNLTVTTDATGYFIFSNRAPGTYTITEVQPAGYVDGKDTAGSSGGTATDATGDSISNIVLLANATSTNNLFGELKTASLAGFVFIDLNNNAQRDVTGVPATDESAGITTVTMTLTGTDDLGPVSATTTTAANGSYSFANLRPGNYQINQAILPGLTHTGMTVGSRGGNDGVTAIAANTPITGASKRSISNITLAQDDAAVNYNFGESGQGLSGFVYVDANNNGVKDAGEAGIAGVAITLSGNTASAISVCTAISPNPCTISTDSNGAYIFVGLPASDGAGYTLTEQSQASSPLNQYADGTDSVGTVNGVASGSAGNDVLSGIVIGTGQVGSNYNFGELGARLAGNVYLDVDQSNTNNLGDTPLAAVTITLSGLSVTGVDVCTLIPTCSISTDVNGDFSFNGLPASNGSGYSISQSQPVDYAEASNTLGTGATAAGSASVVAGNSVFSGVVLSAGQAGVNYLFGEKTGSISGFVYLDTNNNGSKDVGEAGIAGVTVSLTGTAASGASACVTGTCTALSLADGSYLISNLRNANATGYSVSETQPGAYIDGITRKGTVSGISCAACVDTVPNVISAIALNAANAHANFNFGELLNSAISGRVYADLNNNATLDAGEELAGVNLHLSGTDDLGNPVSLNTSTLADGSYSFNNLRPSNGTGYTVTETQPVAWSDFAATTGTQVGSVASISTGTAALNQISAIILPAGNSGVNYNFREAGASVAGSVYLDANGNGTRDAGETGIVGVSIALSGASSATTTTDASGNFSFTGLIAGTYTVSETQPSGYVDGRDLAGSAGGSINAPKNSITNITLIGGSVATGYLFGETLAPVISKLPDGSLAGKVYVDLNNNAQHDQGEPLLADVIMQLIGTDTLGNAVNLQTKTAADGSYLFATVPPGTYDLKQTQPTKFADFAAATGTKVGSLAGGVAQLNSVIQLKMPLTGGVALGYDFRETAALASIKGAVYFDANRNGLRDTGEAGLVEVLVKLQGTDVFGQTIALQQLSNQQGEFNFTGLAEGTYQLVQSQPLGFVDGSDNAGDAGGVINAPKNSITGIQLGALQNASGYLFGEQLGSLSGYVYMDSNDNASKDADEVGIAGVGVSLSGKTVKGEDICNFTICSVHSAADGSFSFQQLPAGTYHLQENQLDLDASKIIDGKETAGKAGGVVDNNSFGSEAGQNAIANIVLSSEVLAANNAVVDGYLFGERPRPEPKANPPVVSGYVWFDRLHTRVRPVDGAHQGVADWTVTLTQNGKLICRTNTDAKGFYQFDAAHCPDYQISGLPTGSGFAIQFSKDGNRLPNVASSGENVGKVSGSEIQEITLHPGDDITEQNLPLDPSGVVYDSLSRLPVAGAVVSITGPAGFDPAKHLLGGVAALAQTTGSDGMYQFMLQNDFPAGTYSLAISSYPANYAAQPSDNIPACQAALVVGASPAPGLVQQSDTAPGLSVPLHKPQACVGMVANGAPSTQYYTSFVITPTSAPIVNNHIPLDPFTPAGLSLSKTGDKQQVEIGESVLYTVQIKQTAGSAVAQLTVLDTLPAGFSLIPGTVKLNGKPLADPQGGRAPLLAFDLGAFSKGQTANLSYRVRVGVGAMQGDGINRAQAHACQQAASCVTDKLLPKPDSTPSNKGEFKVKVMPGVFTDQACVAGKVFVDCNNNHIQDAEELGIPGVRMYLQNGINFTSDSEGKFSYCGLTPNSHVLKVDSTTLPRNSRLTTTSNRNLGDANSLWLDIKNGELIRADFAEGSCSNAVLEQVKARRSQGGVRSVETEQSSRPLPGLRWQSKPAAAPRQATDSANQELLIPRQNSGQNQGAGNAQ